MPAFLLVAAVLALGGCQSSQNAADVIAVEGARESASVPPGSAETIGAGPVLIAAMLAMSADGKQQTSAIEIRNGAALALKELDEGRIRLAVYNTAGSSELLAQSTKKALGEGAKLLLVGPGAGALSAIDAGQAPTVALVANHMARPKGMLAFREDDMSSLVEGLAFAAANGARDIALFAPDGEDVDHIVQMAAQGKPKAAVSVLRYAPGEDPGAILERSANALGKATAIGFSGSDDIVIRLADLLSRKLNLSPAKLPVIGHTGWSDRHFRAPGLQGAIVARPKTADLSSIAGSYEAEYGRPITVEAAYGYDLVAIASGLVRIHGADGLTRNTLQSASGFRGVTGVFRFGRDGSVKRLYAVYVVRAGKLQLLQDAAEGF